MINYLRVLRCFLPTNRDRENTYERFEQERDKELRYRLSLAPRIPRGTFVEVAENLNTISWRLGNVTEQQLLLLTDRVREYEKRKGNKFKKEKKRKRKAKYACNSFFRSDSPEWHMRVARRFLAKDKVWMRTGALESGWISRIVSSRPSVWKEGEKEKDDITVAAILEKCSCSSPFVLRSSVECRLCYSAS